MDHQQLLAALQQAGVNDQSFCIRGHRLPGWFDEGGVLDQAEDGRWFVGGVERGRLNVDRYFESEEAACQHVYDLLTRTRPAPRQRTPEERAADREHSRQRQAELRQEMADWKAQQQSDDV
ncbi:hypothetical protein [Kitasatospora sp. MAP5-34]|uniref:hypothetical protein n=1 Tax=Kitasatospora sp. MAP5-34 TaxID=3035102 RepID=UPI0024754F3F|nr:hypothetical protein [Kitasatospora sp. MAP5-34]MDH6575701.1 hypothetical protein [Kitasatospora sp. MAP5-34]